MSNDLGEKLISLKDATKLLPGNPHVSTIHRWRLLGIRGIRLPTKMIGGRRYIDLAEWELWIAAVTAAADGQPAPVRTSRQRQRSVEAAERELAREFGRPGKSKIPKRL